MVAAFIDRLRSAAAASDSLLCLGLDPDGAADAAAAERRCLELLDGCLEVVCAVKPNIAFFEQFGSSGYAVLERLRRRVPDDRILLIDAKRGDIGVTAAAYARGLFDVLGADAVTLNPLLGRDSIEPFLDRPDRGVFLLTRTSNPGSADFLTSRLKTEERLFERIVTLSQTWTGAGDRMGYVVGATHPEAIAEVRALVGDAPLLTPGVGAQGGDLEATVRSGLDTRGGGLLVPLSRGIANADNPGVAATQLRDAINRVRQSFESPTAP